MKVLFVDDEPEVLEQAKTFLEKENERLKVETARSAEKALKRIAGSDYGVVVSDYKMPEMNGLELLKKLRVEMDSDIPFIVLTGKGSEDFAKRAINLGIDRYFKKIGEPKRQFHRLAEAIMQVGEKESADNLIAWMEVTLAGEANFEKYCLRELSQKADFWITELKVIDSPFDNREIKKVIIAYTDTFSEIPREKLKEINKWTMEIAQRREVTDIDVLVEGKDEKEKTTYLKKNF